jgi:hypothetical protein
MLKSFCFVMEACKIKEAWQILLDTSNFFCETLDTISHST